MTAAATPDTLALAAEVDDTPTHPHRPGCGVAVVRAALAYHRRLVRECEAVLREMGEGE